MERIEWIECPRDAMQGIHEFIPTKVKIEYINSLLKVGFDTIDFGSFVSLKAIPQLKDTADVLSQLKLDGQTKLLAIVANERGAKDASTFEEINYLGFPFSISETFQKRNTNASIDDALKRVDNIQNLCVNANKEMVIYISMGFGNPYGDPYHPEIAAKWIEKLNSLGIKIFAMSDTIGVANPNSIKSMFHMVIPEFQDCVIGAHLHSTPDSWQEKIAATIESGCYRIDSAIKGYGGCPMAKDDLTGNLPTEKIFEYFKKNNIENRLNETALANSVLASSKVF